MSQRNQQVVRIEEQLMEELEGCKGREEVYAFVQGGVFGLFQAAEKDRQLPSVVGSYPRLVAATMRVLRERFGDYTGVGWVFSRLKGLGADSYVIGASGEVYAEVLRARWEGFGDLGRVVELCEEIDQNGVDPTESLVLQMREVLEQVSKDIQGVNGKTAQALHTREDIFANDELGSIVGEWGRKWFVPKLGDENLLHEIEDLDDIHEAQQ
ncbi:hypothetical protein BJ508DRAFT_359788 [Ascobolus immersus RN42]|uniref:Mtf2-like C-terminal domain-containing protein n=1 Tax=Ascobolus immersus RN42 TaxID=1160509 RepID=A0A3N4IJX2_ASCIM|nr:hypothetical protein BJ508DRAFT_359788 [Ascobolus immersus RN42]